MSSKAKPIPETQQGVTPYLAVKGAEAAIEFYQRAFGAIESSRIPMPDGRIGHAEIRIGKALIMMADEYPEIAFSSPETLGGSPVSLHLYVEDVDALFSRAVAAGAKVLTPVADKFYGDRAGRLADPFGHVWMFATHVEDLSAGEIERRAKNAGEE